MTSEEATPSPPSSSAKTVFLIRHAHSLENQRIGSLLNCLGDMSRFSRPKTSDLSSSLELLNMEHDAPLSELGVSQCETMKNMLKENDFVRANKIELVVHSPLQRAKQTCAELIGCSTDELVEGTSKKNEEHPTKSTTLVEEHPMAAAVYPNPVQRVVSTSLLVEKHQLEWVPGNTGGFDKRVIEFQQWLAEQPEKVICVVGHSQYFKRMLQLPFKFDNTDVYCVQYDPNKTTPNEPIIMEYDGTADEITLQPEWYDLKLLHTSREQTPATEESAASTASTENDKSLL